MCAVAFWGTFALVSLACARTVLDQARPSREADLLTLHSTKADRSSINGLIEVF